MLNLNFKLKLILCTCLMSFYQFIVGSSFVFSSILLADLRDPSTPIQINNEDASWIASVPLLVSPVGLIVIGILTDKIGRRKALQVAYIPNVLSWLVLANAHTLNAIIIGRIILGTTFGAATCAYLYLAEVCPTNVRPLYFSVVTIFVGVGMAFQCILAMFFDWQIVSAILFTTSAIGCLSLFLLPETPMWLRSRGRAEEAERAERWFGIEPTAVEVPSVPAVGAMVPAVGVMVPAGSGTYWSLFLRPSVWKPSLVTLAFLVCQQCSGFYVILFYSVDVLRDCRVPWDGITVTVFLSLSRVIGSITFSLLSDIKRKTLVVVSSGGMAVSLAVIVAYQKIYKYTDDPPFSNVLIIAFVAYVFFALLGMLPLPWTLCGEVFPIAIKGLMIGVMHTFGYELMFLVIKVYPRMVSVFGIENVWTVFAGFCLLTVFYSVFIMTETKGKSLDEILSEFEPQKKEIKNILP